MSQRIAPTGVGPDACRGVLTVAAVAAGACTAAHFAPAAVAWRSGRCALLPRLSGVGDRRHVALTFDDGPDVASTPRILEALDRLGWRATFFCLGSQVERSPALARELVSRGHEVGVHGFAHVSHLRRPAPWAIADVARACDLLEEVTGQRMRWFRPPYGALSASALAAARRCRLQLVLWTTWGRDWRRRATGATVAAEVERTLRPGATVLLHDSDLTSAHESWRSTLEALPLLADSWRRLGLVVGPLGEHGLAGGRRATGRLTQPLAG